MPKINPKLKPEIASATLMDNCGKYYVLRYFLPFLFVSFSSFSHISGLDLFLPCVTFVIEFVSGGGGNSHARSLKGMMKGQPGCGRSSNAANICSYPWLNSVVIKCNGCGSKIQKEVEVLQTLLWGKTEILIKLSGEHDFHVFLIISLQLTNIVDFW